MTVTEMVAVTVAVTVTVNDHLTDAFDGARWRFEPAHCGWQHSPRTHCGTTSCAAPPDVTVELQRRRAPSRPRVVTAAPKQCSTASTTGTASTPQHRTAVKRCACAVERYPRRRAKYRSAFAAASSDKDQLRPVGHAMPWRRSHADEYGSIQCFASRICRVTSRCFGVTAIHAAYGATRIDTPSIGS